MAIAQCPSCDGWISWDEAAGFNNDDMPVCDRCMDSHCEENDNCQDIDEECKGCEGKRRGY